MAPVYAGGGAVAGVQWAVRGSQNPAESARSCFAPATNGGGLPSLSIRNYGLNSQKLKLFTRQYQNNAKHRKIKMPLYPNAAYLVRANLEALQRGERVRPIAIGTLTIEQLAVLNEYRTEVLGLPPNEAEVVFIGSHIYKRRIVDDGYTLEDAVDQVMSAMDAQSVVVTGRNLTTIQNLNPRADRYGNQIRDKATLECSGKHPKPELYGVSPKGDLNKPTKAGKPPEGGSL
jgi:hypothetical protein